MCQFPIIEIELNQPTFIILSLGLSYTLSQNAGGDHSTQRRKDHQIFKKLSRVRPRSKFVTVETEETGWG